ncbi:hypothetical protein SeLEV6574_g03715 [Synchytrium endobioticum]|uniref:Uncharacterized protein n=1 Tax=Synchytrium endobioticum TaxID=286115 RepID=A0A507D341_9FUNG|nr:hypothetical protein SeLEV6574_g03715 [Synchytrium endobioticum]
MRKRRKPRIALLPRYLLQLWSSFGRVMHQSGKMKINIVGCLLLSAILFLSLVAGLPAGNQGDNVQNVEAEQTPTCDDDPVELFKEWLNQRGWKLKLPETGPLQATDDVEYLKTQLTLAKNLLKKLGKNKRSEVDEKEAAVIHHYLRYFRNVKGFPSAAVLKAMEKKGQVREYASLAVDHCRFMIKVIDHWNIRVDIVTRDDTLAELMKIQTDLLKENGRKAMAIFERLKTPGKETVDSAIRACADLNEEHENQGPRITQFAQSLTSDQQGPRVEPIANRAEQDRSTTTAATTTPSTSMPSMGYGPSSSTGSASRPSGGRRSGRGSRRVSK